MLKFKVNSKVYKYGYFNCFLYICGAEVLLFLKVNTQFLHLYSLQKSVALRAYTTFS